jgi:integrase
VIPERAIRTFVDVVGDKPLQEISRSDAVAFYKFWLERVSPEGSGEERWSPSSGNRQIEELRKLYREYFDHVHDQPERTNPFRGLSFKEGAKNKRPAFSDDWIQKRFCTSEQLLGLNDEARAILLAMVETGARPSELCNLTQEAIRIDADIPHLAIEERLDPEAPRELKSGSSKRYIPLVGVSLEVFRSFNKGFPRYWEAEENLSATINKYLSKNGLRETPRHSLYSLRHSFEDRMLRAGFDESLRIALFGHKSERPLYGDAGGLEWKRDQLLKIAFPYQLGALRR